MTFLIIPNLLKKNAIEFTYALCRFLRKNGHRIQMEETTAICFEDLEPAIFHQESMEQTGDHPSAVLILGGDGTILSSVPLLYRLNLPIFGVNFGHVGYLTCCEPEQCEERLRTLLAGQMPTEKRILLEGRLNINGKTIASGAKDLFIALNEAVIHRGSIPHAIHPEIFCDGRRLGRFSGDGILISTPTGSTAYNLSAGGPVLLPEMECFAITPLCPTTVLSSPVVVPSSSRITVRLDLPEEGGSSLALDGYRHFVQKGRVEIEFWQSRHTLQMYAPRENHFCRILHDRMVRDDGASPAHNTEL